MTGSKLVTAYKLFRKPAGFVGLILISIVFAFIVKSMAIKGAALILVLLIGPFIAVTLVALPRVGIIIHLIAAYLLFGVIRMGIINFPLGTILDGILMLLMIGIAIQQKYKNDWQFMKSPISFMVLIWILYNFIEVLNPQAESKMAWLYTIRGLALVMLTYFVFAYHIKDVKYIRTIIKLWLGLSVFAALYGFKQQFIGFTSYELAYLYSDPLIMDLLFIGGQWRKFSFFSDPTAFSYNMVVSSLLCVGLMFGPISKIKKAILGGFIALFLAAMLFSGTRSAYVLIPAAMFMLVILVFNIRIMLIAGVISFFLVILIFIPTSNPVLYRFQSAFKPSNDASFNVRASNQKMIQPYILSHPLGGGLGSTGVWGAKFSPGSFLASFPPDSGYVRVAVETGWVGLLIFCSLLFIIMRAGIINFFNMRDPELKSYCLAMVIIVYAIIVGNYPQEALTQYPLSVYFFLVAALINTTRDIDNRMAAEKEEAEKLMQGKTKTTSQ